MNLNNDVSQRVCIDTTTLEWVPSPVAGVMRKMLQRDGGEQAKATSLVRYVAHARFDRHEHDMGEDFFVLEGEFADEHGRYPTGTYVRNPPGSSHAPFTDAGCTIFVKLRHFDALDRTRHVVDTRGEGWLPGPGLGIDVHPLGGFGRERVSLVRCAPRSSLPAESLVGGLELFVLQGELADEGGRYREGCWLRLPEGARHAFSSPDGCLFFSKRGHLGASASPPAP